MDFDATAVEEAVTVLGNLAIVGPAAVVALLWLVYRRGGQAAFRFLWPVALTFVLIFCLKVLARDTGTFNAAPFVLSAAGPSGHVAMSTVVYGGVALMLLRRGVEPIGLLTALLVLMTLTGIAVTEVLFWDHTVADVAAGFVTGGICAACVALGAEVPTQERERDAAELVILVAAMVALMSLSGVRFDTAAII
jgi:membrane-associated phospholipid phosphatase